MIDYSIFPSWMGISNFGDLIAAIICCWLLFFVYCIFGYAFCPDVNNRFIRVICILFWPIMIILDILLFPIHLVYEFSKPKKEIEKEINEFIKENM